MAEAAEETPRDLKKILLIEDNPADARLVDIFLKESTMIEVELVKAETLQAGLQKLEEQEFDAILLDLTLPDSQGFNTIRTMIEEFPEYTIIVMTGMEDETVALNSVKAGAQDFIVKGNFDGALLSRTVSYAIERHQLTKRVESYAREIQKNEKRLIEAQKMARIGNWELDIVTNKMYWSDEVYRILGHEERNFEPTLHEYLEHVASGDVERVRSEINRTMEKGAQYRIEYALHFPDGSHKVVANQGQIQMSRKSGGIVLVGTIQDISSFRGQAASPGENGPIELLQEGRQLSRDLLGSSLADDQRTLVERIDSILERLEG